MSNFHHLPDLRKLHISNAANGKAISPNLRTRGVGPSMAGALSPVMDRSRAAPPIVAIPEDIENAPAGDPPMDRLRTYVKSLPYAVESNAEMQELLDHILTRLAQCVRAKDFDPGFLQWDSMV